MAQVKHIINIFKTKTKSLAQGLFIFNNILEHIKYTLDMITAKMIARGVL